MIVKGYKVFNPDWTCRDFHYEVGKTYKHEGEIELCEAGFHFCQKASDCFTYYGFDSDNKVAEVEALGLVVTDKSKSVTNEIKIVREIPWAELLTIVNDGKDNRGLCNTGNCNTGNCNIGSYNIGHFNTGHYNTGSWNIGSWNIGDCNIGNWNIGDWNTGYENTGYHNTGSRNTGDWNVTDFNSGFFTTKELPIYMFNKPTKYTSQREIRNLDGMRILHLNYRNSWWVFSFNMTEEEKEEHPEYKTAGGYLKTVDFKTACKRMWNRLKAKDKELVMQLPNFDKDIFYEVTGIDIEADN